MTRRFPKLIAVTGVVAALAVGSAGIAQASPDRNSSNDRHGASHERHSRDGHHSGDRSRDRDGNDDGNRS